MDCEKFEPLLQASLDGDLDPPSQASLDEHLAHCPRCRAKDAMLKSSINALKELDKPSTSSALTTRIMTAIFQERKWRRTWAAIASCMGAVLLAIILPLFINTGPVSSLLLNSAGYTFFRDILLMLPVVTTWSWRAMFIVFAALLLIPAAVLIKNNVKYI
jgi:predicted anti-sigma-YlaC factor YlaD